ncbi:hypothetical protein KAH94_01245 [bacterium]|nr:hypothetical protein [bacterium]
MLNRIATFLWGKFESNDELKKFLTLAAIFFCIIGTYWAMRPLKDSVFVTMVGVDFLPWAKILSVSIMVPLVILYTKLIDSFARHKVFYILISIYAILALVFTYFLMHSQYGLANDLESPWRIVGWLWYAYVESFGSLIVALFWVITTDITLPESARRGFPIIALFGQLGNIVGPFVLRASRFGFANSAPIAGLCAIVMFFTGILLWYFMKVTPVDNLKGYEAQEIKKPKGKKEAVGFLDGLKLIFTNGYLLGIFLMISAYEAIVVVFDYHFKSMAKVVYSTEVSYASFLGEYAVWTGIVSSLCVFLGINSIQRRLGMTASLILMPLFVGIATIALKLYPALGVAFWIMVFAKAVNYALNAPTIKQLYIPTTKDVRYKSQGWIEMFGSRAAKSGGSFINMTRGVFKAKYGATSGINLFLTISTIASLGIVAGWLFIAMFVAATYNKATKEEKYVC